MERTRSVCLITAVLLIKRKQLGVLVVRAEGEQGRGGTVTNVPCLIDD